MIPGVEQLVMDENYHRARVASYILLAISYLYVIFLSIDFFVLRGNTSVEEFVALNKMDIIGLFSIVPFLAFWRASSKPVGLAQQRQLVYLAILGIAVGCLPPGIWGYIQSDTYAMIVVFMLAISLAFYFPFRTSLFLHLGVFIFVLTFVVLFKQSTFFNLVRVAAIFFSFMALSFSIGQFLFALYLENIIIRMEVELKNKQLEDEHKREQSLAEKLHMAFGKLNEHAQERFSGLQEDKLTADELAEYILNMANSIERQQEELETASQKYRAIFDTAHDAITVLDENARIIEANPSAIKLIGYDPAVDEVHVSDIIFHEDKEKSRQYFESLLRDGHYNNYEGRIVTKAGNVRHIEVNSVGIFDEDGKFMGSRDMLRDVSQRILHEDKLRFNQQINEVLATISLDFINLKPNDDINAVINTSLKRLVEAMDVDRAYIFDYNKEKNTVSNTYEWAREGISPEIENLQDIPTSELRWWMNNLLNFKAINVASLDELPSEEVVQREILEAQSIKSLVVVPIVSAGELRGFMGFDAVRHERTWSDESIYVLQMAANIFFTSQVRQTTDIALRNLIEELKIANRSLKEFAHVVSHDLKTPLRAIYTLATWLIEDYHDQLGGQGKENLLLMQDRAQKMENLINGILAYSMIENSTANDELLNLNQVAAEAAGSMAPVPNIQIKIAEGLPSVVANRHRIGQLFQNLLSNAVKYMDKEKGLVEVIYHASDDPYHHFEIKDNGMGIAPKHHEKVFKIFQKLTDKSESTGIGLSIVKRIIEIYGGEIYLDSDLGKGTSVHFTLKKNNNLSGNWAD